MKTFYSFLLLAITVSGNSFAQWDGNNTTVNNPVTTASPGGPVFSIADQYGGVIIAWEAANQVFVQRKTVGGQLNWGTASNPVALFNGTGGSIQLRDAISDNESGVYVCYQHRINDTTSRLYVQHIASNGIKRFPNPGILINPANSSFCGDGKIALSNDGIFVAWTTEDLVAHDPVPLKSKLYLQRIDKGGNFMLGASGIPVTSANSLQFWPILCPDKNGGIYLAFSDTRNSNFVNGSYNNYDVYAQRFDANGNKLWAPNDVVISNAPFHQTTHIDYSPPGIRNEKTILTSADGAVYVLYGSAEDENYTDNYFLEIKKLSPAGINVWPNAVKTSDAATAHHYLQVEDDNESGLVISWRRTGGMAFIYAQRINNAGARMWGNTGILVPPDYDMDFQMTGHSMAKTGDGNFVFTWRADTSIVNVNDVLRYIKAQKLDGAGNKLWGANAVFISKNNFGPISPIVSKSLDSASIISWLEQRGIYSALVESNGALKNIENISGYTAIASGNWNDPATWLNGLIPPAGANVTITQNVTVNVNVICYNITVQSPAVLTVAPGATLTVLN